MTDHPRGTTGGPAKMLLGAVMAVAALAMAACGSSGSNRTVTHPPASVAPSGGQPSATTPCTIPQGNGGDHDVDNSGGPSDGDGCDI